MIQQVEIILRGRPRGFHLVTREISEQLPSLPQTGLLNLFVKHTSCALSINENADPDVRTDMTKYTTVSSKKTSLITIMSSKVPTTCRPMPNVA